MGLFNGLSFRPQYGSGVETASIKNEYQGYLLGGKGGQYVGLTSLPLLCVDYVEILRALTSWSPKGLFRSVLGWLLNVFSARLHYICMY